MEKPNDESTTKLNIKPLINKLKKLFEYYCQYGEKLNTKSLKSNKFIKLSQECGLIDKKLNRTRLELIYKVESKNNLMNFNEFLNSLVKIAKWKYSEETNKTKALNMILTNYLIPRHDEIFNIINFNQGDINSIVAERKISTADNSKIVGKDSYLSPIKLSKDTSAIHHENNFSTHHINNSVIITVPSIDENIYDKNVEEILFNLSPILFDIYKTYFPHEISNSDNLNYIIENSDKNFYIFLKDFDLYPGLISKPLAFQIYSSEQEENCNLNISTNKEQYFKLIKNIEMNKLLKYNHIFFGQFFNFFKFIRVILKISDVAFEKLEKLRQKGIVSISHSRVNSMTNIRGNTSIANNCYNNFIPFHEKLLLTIERMELSEGFINLERKTNKTHSLKNSYMMSPRLIEKIKSNTLNSNFNSFIFDKDNFSSSNLLAGISSEEKLKCLNFINNYQNICEFTNYIIETYGNELNYVYKAFCSFGDPLNTKFMTSKIFTKLLKESNLIITRSDYSLLNMSSFSNMSMSASNIFKISKNLNKSSLSTNINKIGLKMNEIDSIFIKLSSLCINKTKNDNFIQNLDQSDKTPLNSKSNNVTTITGNNFNINSNSSINYAHVRNLSFNDNNSVNNYSSFKVTIKKFDSSPVLSGAKINFNSFIIGIEVIARLIFPLKEIKESIELIIKDYILKNLTHYIEKIKLEENKFDYLKEKESDEELLFILDLVSKTFFNIYKFYSDKRGLLKFDQLIKFAKDFDIFPYFLSKSKLNFFFNGLLENYINHNNEIIENDIKNKNENFINYSQFVDLLTLCAFEFIYPEPEPTPVVKILFLIEKICNSQGPEKILISKLNYSFTNEESLNLLLPYKKMYPEYFTVEEPKKEEFFDIIVGNDF